MVLAFDRIRSSFIALLSVAAALAACVLVHAQSSPANPAHVFFRVQAASSLPGPVSGRLLVFVKQGSGDKEVDITEFHPQDTWVAAEEIHDLKPGDSVEFDADTLAYPHPFSQLAAGSYEAQAVLDVDHAYNYSGRTADDWISAVVALTGWNPAGGVGPALTLDHRPEDDPRHAQTLSQARAQAKPGVAQLEEVQSPLLSRFWGRSMKIKAWVILPPGYDANGSTTNSAGTYPTAYWTHGFGSNIDSALVSGLRIRQRMVEGKMPPMIWVMLDESIPEGTHEFADSVNNGPWGTALTTEFIPYLEAHYRMDARPSSRLLNGHSSGGWATLQLQVNYPEIFGGTWSTSPDPSDFHDFTGPDLYDPHANLYRRPDGTPYPIFRDQGKVIATLEQFGHLETVLGPYGGQLTSFDWVFSPKGKDGAPEPLFDRETGAIDPEVAAYWREHYDLAHICQANWATRGAALKGKIHVIVGTADTFYLDGPAHKFDAVLAGLGADAHFTYLPGKTHMDLYGVGDDRMGLFDQIGAEMYAAARPGVAWKK
jgi:S-formylglutathione hydrolase FrmB